MADPLPPSTRNRASIPRGTFDLTSDSSFHPVRVDREPGGRWIIRYHLNTAADVARFQRQQRFYDREDEANQHMRMDSVAPFTEAQEAALQRIIRRIEGVCQVRFQRVENAADANVCLYAADFDTGTLGRVRNLETATTEVVVANRLNMSRPGGGQQQTFNDGEPGYGTLMHELLHAMGLCHPNLFTYANGRNGSVMCYDGDGGPAREDNDLGRYDIAALQYLYGEPNGLTVAGHPSGLPRPQPVIRSPRR